jgi:NAD(P)-dependent dehydrogenase (short-subunit alcohol dehydrogenase family)
VWNNIRVIDCQFWIVQKHHAMRTQEASERIYRINLIGPFILTQTIIPACWRLVGGALSTFHPPMKRAGQPENIAAARAFLSPEVAGYITGQTIGVNGGRVIY